MNGHDILLRGISPELKDWIGKQSAERRVSKSEFLRGLVDEAFQDNSQPSLFEAPPKNSVQKASPSMPFSFIDLFAGIGGLRLGAEAAGGRCLFSSEWDEHSKKTYKAWYGDEPHGDITKIPMSDIPDHDLLVGGFPCQPFSIAGVSKKNALGRPHGFKDATQGNLFFNVATIIEQKRPPAVLLENVKNLQSHDKGRTWSVVRKTLLDLNYSVFTQVVDASAYVPQHRERIFIACFDKRIFGDNPSFEFPEKPVTPRRRFADILDPLVDPKYTLSDHLWKYLQDYALRHKAQGNGFGFGLAPMDGVSRTLSARYYKDGSEILIAQPGNNPRRLTPREAARLMGFPDSLPIVVSDTQAYRQFGNAVVPLVAEAVITQIAKVFRQKYFEANGGCLFKTPALAPPPIADEKVAEKNQRAILSKRNSKQSPVRANGHANATM